jgi:hypothetical protein
MTKSLYFSNRKEYYRRKKISVALKRYWAERKKRERIIKAQVEEEKQFSKMRIRRQLAFNSDYSVSIRAITINGSWTFEEMQKEIDEFLLSNSTLLTIPFFIEGQEETELDSDEDKHLKEKSLYIELNIRGDVEIIKWRD